MSAATAPLPSTGAHLQYGLLAASFTAATTGWTTLGNVTDLSKLPSVKYPGIETTLLNDTVEKQVAGRGKPSDWEAKCQYDNATYTIAAGLLKTQSRFRVLFSDGTGIGWEGFISEAPLQVITGKLVEMQVKGETSGDTTKIDAVS